MRAIGFFLVLFGKDEKHIREIFVSPDHKWPHLFGADSREYSITITRDEYEMLLARGATKGSAPPFLGPR